MNKIFLLSFLVCSAAQASICYTNLPSTNANCVGYSIAADSHATAPAVQYGQIKSHQWGEGIDVWGDITNWGLLPQSASGQTCVNGRNWALFIVREGEDMEMVSSGTGGGTMVTNYPCAVCIEGTKQNIQYCTVVVGQNGVSGSAQMPVAWQECVGGQWLSTNVPCAACEYGGAKYGTNTLYVVSVLPDGRWWTALKCVNKGGQPPIFGFTLVTNTDIAADAQAWFSSGGTTFMTYGGSGSVGGGSGGGGGGGGGGSGSSGDGLVISADGANWLKWFNQSTNGVISGGAGVATNSPTSLPNSPADVAVKISNLADVASAVRQGLTDWGGGFGSGTNNTVGSGSGSGLGVGDFTNGLQSALMDTNGISVGDMNGNGWDQSGLSNGVQTLQSAINAWTNGIEGLHTQLSQTNRLGGAPLAPHAFGSASTIPCGSISILGHTYEINFDLSRFDPIPSVVRGAALVGLYILAYFSASKLILNTFGGNQE